MTSIISRGRIEREIESMTRLLRTTLTVLLQISNTKIKQVLSKFNLMIEIKRVIAIALEA